MGLLYGKKVTASEGRLSISLPPNNGEIYAPSGKNVTDKKDILTIPVEKKSMPGKPNKEKGSVESKPDEKKSAPKADEVSGLSQGNVIPDIPYAEMTVEQLQAVILEKMSKNGPVTDQMRRDVENNIWHDSLVKWAGSFR